MLAKLPSVCKKLLFVKVDFWNSISFLVNIFVKYRDCRVRQTRITKCDRFKDYKVWQSWITECDRSWITKCDKKFKNWITKCSGITECGKLGLQIAMGSQTATDHRCLIDENGKVFWSYFENIWFIPRERNMKIWLMYANKISWIT